MSNVPKLRFKEFSGEWEETILKNISTFYNGRAYKQAELLNSGKYPVLRVGNFFTNDSWYYSDLELDENKYCDNGDLLYAWSASFGPRIWKGEKVIYHYHIWKVENHDDITKKYLYILLDNETAKMKAQSANGFALLHITKGTIENWKVNIPSKQEQEKIASFLTSVDTKIEQLTKKEELLSSYKKGVMQKIFSGEIRFKADDGSEFCEWEEKKLGEYLKLKSKKNKDNLVDLVLSVSNKKGFITQDEQFDGYEVASKDTSGYKIVEKGDYAYNPSRINVGSIARLKNYDTGIVSPMYVVFSLTNKMSPIFFDSLYQLHRFKHLIKIGCSGSVRDSLAFDDMADFKITVPCLEEQTKIANFL